MKVARKTVYVAAGIFDRFYCGFQRLRLKNLDFTIISSNCWGGSVYEDLNLPYRTPTIGLFFFGPCFVKFVSDLKSYCSGEIQFVTQSKYETANRAIEKHPYPIGVIGDIEVHFLHYKTVQEAADKWYRRVARINYDNMFISFTDRDDCSEFIMDLYDKLPMKNKVLFTAKKMNLDCSIQLTKFANCSMIGDIYSDRWSYRKNFDVVKWLNSGNKGTR